MLPCTRILTLTLSNSNSPRVESYHPLAVMLTGFITSFRSICFTQKVSEAKLTGLFVCVFLEVST